MPSSPAVSVHADAAAAGTAVAKAMIAAVVARPDLVLGLATGSSVEPLYAELIRACRAGEVSFARVTTFNLDEYVGIAPDNPASYRATMRHLLFDHIDIDPARTHVPDGMAADTAAAARDYEDRIARAGGIDLQLLGIGRNGHIGFNEPGTPFDSPTGVVDLHEATLQANASFFADGRVPPTAITMGIGTILKARRILVLATGDAKTTIVAQSLNGPITTDCPATALRRHDRVEWYLDTTAAAALGQPFG